MRLPRQLRSSRRAPPGSRLMCVRVWGVRRIRLPCALSLCVIDFFGQHAAQQPAIRSDVATYARHAQFCATAESYMRVCDMCVFVSVSMFVLHAVCSREPREYAIFVCGASLRRLRGVICRLANELFSK